MLLGFGLCIGANNGVAGGGEPVAPTFSQAPSISGSAQVGGALTAVQGLASGSPSPVITGKWQTSPNGTDTWTDLGDTDLSFTNTSSELTEYISFLADATNDAGSTTSRSNVVGPITEPERLTPSIAGGVAVMSANMANVAGLTFTLPGALVGDTAYVGLCLERTTSINAITPPTNATIVGSAINYSQSTTQIRNVVYEIVLEAGHINGSNEAVLAFTWTSQLAAGGAILCKDADLTNPEDNDPNNGTGTTTTVPANVVASNHALRVCFNTDWSGNTGNTNAPSGWTVAGDIAGYFIAFKADNPAGAAGSTTCTNGNSTGSDTWSSHSIIIRGKPGDALAITRDIPVAMRQDVLNELGVFSASGGTAPYTYSVVSGSVPTGLTLDPDIGTLFGTPTAAIGDWPSFTVRVTDDVGATADAVIPFITIEPELPLIPVGFPHIDTHGCAYWSTIFATSSGTLTIGAGVAIDGRLHNGNVVFSGAGGSLTNSIVRGQSTDGALVNANQDDITISATTIDGQQNSKDGIIGYPTLNGVKAVRCENNVNVYDAMVMDNCFFFSTGTDYEGGGGDPHFDCIENNGAAGMEIRNSTCYLDHGSTAAVMMNNEFSTFNGAIVEDNFLYGGGYTVYCESDKNLANTVTGSTIHLRNNVIDGGAFGEWTVTGPASAAVITNATGNEDIAGNPNNP